MIKSFKDADTERIYRRTRAKSLPTSVQRAALRKLRMLNNATSITDLRSPPGNRLEKLQGERLGQYAIRINDQWRICFEWIDQNAHNVEITDYH